MSLVGVWDVVVLLACHGRPFQGMRRGSKGALTTIGGRHSWAPDVAEDLRGGGIDNGDVLQGGAFGWGDEAHERATPRQDNTSSGAILIVGATLPRD